MRRLGKLRHEAERNTALRLLVHDFVGHPFQVQLSRELARRGWSVRHAYCASKQSPRGAMARRKDDPVSFEVMPLDLGAEIPQQSGYFKRLRMEARYGELVKATCHEFRPDIVLSGNTPSLPQRDLCKWCKKNGVKHIFWVQDLYGVATHKILSKRIPVLGHIVGKYFMHLDKCSAKLSDSLVLITEDFRAIFNGWGIADNRMHVIPNWSVLDELPERPRENSWSQENSLTTGPRLIYTGTLAMKHNPALLLALARSLDRRGEGELIVVSEGPGIEWLRESAAAEGVKSLRCLGFQPFERLADTLGSADILLVLLEMDAGVFSVPSKVLSYLCAGRPIVGAMPAQNLAGRIIVDNGAGIVVAPDDEEGFCAAAQRLLDAPDHRRKCGIAARRYAVENFDLGEIADRFQSVLQEQCPISPAIDPGDMPIRYNRHG